MLIYRTLAILSALMVLAVNPSVADPQLQSTATEQKTEIADELQPDTLRVSHGQPPWAPVPVGKKKENSKPAGENDSALIQTSLSEPQYREHDFHYLTFEAASQKVGISFGKCNRKTIGSLLKKNSNGFNKAVTVKAGHVVGSVVSQEIGRNMDKADAQCTSQVLERARDGQAVFWENPNTGYRYSITPYGTFRHDDGRYCRKYRTTVNSENKTLNSGDTACRNTDGRWEKLS